MINIDDILSFTVVTKIMNGDNFKPRTMDECR